MQAFTLQRMLVLFLLAGQNSFANAASDVKPVRLKPANKIIGTHTATTVLKPEHWMSEHFVDHPLVGTVWSGYGRRSGWTALTSALIDAKYVLVGEIHTNTDHHDLQSRVVEILAQNRRKPVVAWEMIPQNKQPLLDSPGLTTTTGVRGLAKALNWSSSGWPDWSMYEPIALAAVRYGLPMRGAALNQKFLKSLARTGESTLSPAIKSRLHLNKPLADADNQSMLRLLDESHCGMIPAKSLTPMQWIQRARDGAMADAMLRSPQKTQGAVLIAGNVHVRKDWGVPALLERHSKPPAADRHIVAIAQLEVSDGAIEPSDYAEFQNSKPLYDFVVFTPRSEIKDHCAALRKRFKR